MNNCDTAPRKWDWRSVWALFAKRLPTVGLQALAWELERGGLSLCRNHPVLPVVAEDTADGPITHAEPVAYCLWKGTRDITTVAEAINAWHFACVLVCQDMGDTSGVRFWFNWWDEVKDRRKANGMLLLEVRTELLRRGTREATEPMVVVA